MPVSRHPPRRSRRAALPHRALASGQTQKRLSLPLVPCSARSTLLPASVCRSWSPDQSSPLPRAFSPRTPLVVGHAELVVHLCSSASQILPPCPTSHSRACRDCGLRPFSTGPTADHNRPILGSPGFRAKSLHACLGSLTPPSRFATRAIVTNRVAFPVALLGRLSEWVISELITMPTCPLSTLRRPPSREADA